MVGRARPRVRHCSHCLFRISISPRPGRPMSWRPAGWWLHAAGSSSSVGPHRLRRRRRRGRCGSRARARAERSGAQESQRGRGRSRYAPDPLTRRGRGDAWRCSAGDRSRPPFFIHKKRGREKNVERGGGSHRGRQPGQVPPTEARYWWRRTEGGERRGLVELEAPAPTPQLPPLYLLPPAGGRLELRLSW